VLTQLKKNLLDAGAGDLPGQVKLVVVDTSEYELINGQQVPVQFAGVEISPDEVVKLDENLDQLIKNLSGEPELQTWFPNYAGLAPPEKDLSKGTYGRRPLARAGLVRDVQKLGPAQLDGAGSEGSAGARNGTTGGSRIWNLLMDGASQISSEGGVRIIVVGSLAGGMSGVLWDVAYLAQRAVLIKHGTAVSATIEGYFATHSTFSGLEGVAPQRLAANTFGALRELRRFQLNPGLPYPMRYKQLESGTVTGARVGSDAGGSVGASRGSNLVDVLASSCDWRLFSDVFLFGPHYAALSEPQNGTFASIADIIALRLDKASHGVGGGDWYNQMRAQVSQRQVNDEELALGTAGSFVYRLPAYDIMEIVKLRWVRALLEQFMMGQAGVALRLTNPNLAGDPELHGVTADPGAMVPIFLRGWLRPKERAEANWHSAAALGALASVEDQSQSFETELSRVLEDDPEQVAREFDITLGYALGWILNGADTPEAIQARAGKVGYSVSFLEALASRLDLLKDQLRALQAQAAQGQQSGSERASRLEALETARSGFAEVVGRYRARVNGITQALGRSIDRVGTTSAHGDQQAMGLFELVAERATRLETTWRQQLNDIKVREYLWTLAVSNGDRGPDVLALCHRLPESRTLCGLSMVVHSRHGGDRRHGAARYCAHSACDERQAQGQICARQLGGRAFLPRRVAGFGAIGTAWRVGGALDRPGSAGRSAE
jgi:hypothetical protein